MLTPETVRARIEPVLTDLENSVAAFARSLEDERRILSAAVPDGLDSAVAAKDAAARQVADGLDRLRAMSRDCGYRDDASGVRDCIRFGARANPNLSVRHEVLTSQAARCESGNQAHGRLLAMRRAATEQALEILLGRPAGPASGVYDAQGRRSTTRSGQALDVV